MSRPKRGGGARMVELTCIACGVHAVFPASSPAAPILTACEAAAEHGWSYQIGFVSILTGDHRPRCRECTATGRRSKGDE